MGRYLGHRFDCCRVLSSVSIRLVLLGGDGGVLLVRRLYDASDVFPSAMTMSNMFATACNLFASIALMFCVCLAHLHEPRLIVASDRKGNAVTDGVFSLLFSVLGLLRF